MELKVELLKWQQEVFSDDTRFKVVAAGRRCGKSRLAAWSMIIRALQNEKCTIFYVAPTQGQARDIMWSVIEDLAYPVIASKHVNNMEFKLVNGSRISLKGADRPDTMRGVSLEYLVMDEYADMKPQVWEEVLRPALADRQGDALFIGTPKGRNHFYDLYVYADKSEDESYKSWHFTSYNNETLKEEEINLAKQSMSSYAFRQEFMASFEALGSEIFKEEWVQFDEEEPSVDAFKKNHWKNLHRLYVWLMVGADVENGRWAVYGAREGLYKTMCTDWDFVNVRDFEWLNQYWESLEVTEENLNETIEEFGSMLIDELEIPIAEECLNAQQSYFFKTLYQNPSRIPRKGK